MFMKKLFFVTVILLCFFANKTLAQTINGFVFEDLNKDGIKQNNEPGIKGVAVSDQVNIVRTDEKGFYQIDNKGFGIIFISLPSDYSTKKFWQNISSSPVNFGLTKTPAPKNFQFIHASDTHISEKTIDRMDKFRAITDSVDPAFVLITGDLVKDALRVGEKEASGLYELFISESRKIRSTQWLVPGNHELFGIERMSSLVSPQNPLYGRKMYRHYLGPDYYSFNYGGIHFIALNSVDFEDLWYYGHIDSVQLAWLKKDLALIDTNTTVVTYQHISFYSGALSMGGYSESGLGRSLERENGVLEFRHVVSNAVEVISILNRYHYVLALAGHDHARELFRFEGLKTRFDQAAAVIGPGGFIPPIESPSGVTVYQVTNGVIEEGKFIRLDKK